MLEVAAAIEALMETLRMGIHIGCTATSGGTEGVYGCSDGSGSQRLEGLGKREAMPVLIAFVSNDIEMFGLHLG